MCCSCMTHDTLHPAAISTVRLGYIRSLISDFPGSFTVLLDLLASQLKPFNFSFLLSVVPFTSFI